MKAVRRDGNKRGDIEMKNKNSVKIIAGVMAGLMIVSALATAIIMILQ